MLHPLIKWAQRKDRVFLQIQLRDIKNEKIDLNETTVSFQGQSDSKKYGFTLQFYAQINKQQSKWTKTGFHLFFALIKKDQNAQFWPRLTKNKEKNQYIQVDWQKWVDEDEEEQEGNKGLGDFDPSQMQNFNFGGMGGMPGMGMPGMGMPGMGGMPGMQGMMGGDEDDQQGEGNLDDLDKQEQVEEPVKKQQEAPKQ